MLAVRRLDWTLLAPLLALVGLAATWGREISGVAVLLIAVLLVGAVLAAHFLIDPFQRHRLARLNLAID